MTTESKFIILGDMNTITNFEFRIISREHNITEWEVSLPAPYVPNVGDTIYYGDKYYSRTVRCVEHVVESSRILVTAYID